MWVSENMTEGVCVGACVYEGVCAIECEMEMFGWVRTLEIMMQRAMVAIHGALVLIPAGTWVFHGDPVL